MVFIGQQENISSARFGQDVTLLQRDGRLIPVVRVQACGVNPELLAQLGQEGAWVEYRTLVVTANQTFDRAQSMVVYAGSLVPMEKLPSMMQKAKLVRQICQAAQPKADVMKVMLLAEPIHAEQEVWMWRREVLSSKSKLYEAIAQDPQDERVESELPELGDAFWGSGPDVMPDWVKEVQSFQLRAKRGAAYWQEEADRLENAPHMLWQNIFVAMEKMRMSEDATARLAVYRASMTIFLQLTELELANYLCTHFQRLCDTVTPEAPNIGSSTTPLDPHVFILMMMRVNPSQMPRLMSSWQWG